MTVFKKVATLISDSGALQKKDIDVCAYGLEVMFSTLIEFASIFTVSFFIGNFLETVFFFLAFVPLRIYAGGYHADTKLRCYIISLVVYGIFSLIINSLDAKYFLLAGVLAIAVTVITVMIYAPVIHSNRNVNSKEKSIYRKFSVVICFLEALISVVMFALIKQKIIALSFALGQAAVAISMLVAIFKVNTNRKRGWGYEGKG